MHNLKQTRSAYHRADFSRSQPLPHDKRAGVEAPIFTVKATIPKAFATTPPAWPPNSPGSVHKRRGLTISLLPPLGHNEATTRCHQPVMYKKDQNSKRPADLYYERLV